MKLPTHDAVLFADNEVLLLAFPRASDWNNAIVLSTGDPDKYKVQRLIRVGIVSNQTLTYMQVVQLALEMHAMGAELRRNMLFPGGLTEIIKIGEEHFNEMAKTDERFALAKQRIHEEWDSLTITDSSGNTETIPKKVSSAGITGVSHPWGN